MTSHKKKCVQSAPDAKPFDDACASGSATDLSKTPASSSESAPGDTGVLQVALAANQGDYLRLAADFDNFRKRTRRDAARDAAVEKEAFIRDLLPILDNFGRALASDPSTPSAQFRHGVEGIAQELGRLLNRNGIEAVQDVGRPFDPHRHEAISMRCDPSQPDHVVLEVLQRGYNREDSVFRPAKVIVNDRTSSSGVRHGH